jgi:hypothetical protein
LILANKCDLINTLTSDQLLAALNLHSIRDRPWKIILCSGMRGDGLQVWAHNPLISSACIMYQSESKFGFFAFMFPFVYLLLKKQVFSSQTPVFVWLMMKYFHHVLFSSVFLLPYADIPGTLFKRILIILHIRRGFSLYWIKLNIKNCLPKGSYRTGGLVRMYMHAFSCGKEIRLSKFYNMVVFLF